MKKGLKLKDDSDLRGRRENDDYNREKILKYFVLILFIVFISFVGVLFIIRCVNDLAFQYAVLDLVKQNVSGIAFLGISLLGINQYYKNK